ncbi:cyclophilin-like fold protein [Morganella morganii]
MKKPTLNLTFISNPHCKTSLMMVLVISLQFFTQFVIADDSDKGDKQVSFMKIQIIIDGETTNATLFDTPTGRDFASMLPLNLTLEEYADIERISQLPRMLSQEHAPDGMIPKSGDITFYVPWGNLAIFIQGRPYAHSLIPVGKIDSGLTFLERRGPLSVHIRAVD